MGNVGRWFLNRVGRVKARLFRRYFNDQLYRVSRDSRGGISFLW